MENSSLKNRNYSRELRIILRLGQAFLVFSALWFVYWAHIYEMIVWNKTFIQTLGSTVNVAGYIISILILLQLEYEVRQLKNDTQTNPNKTK